MENENIKMALDRIRQTMGQDMADFVELLFQLQFQLGEKSGLKIGLAMVEDQKEGAEVKA
jgi:hypothetical protein